MSIRDFLNRIKSHRDVPQPSEEIISFEGERAIVKHSILDKVFLAVLIVLVASLSFGFGRLSVVGDREPIRIEYDPELTTHDQTANVLNATKPSGPTVGEEVVVSKNGTRYHYRYCAGAKQIKEQNKIVFVTPAAAEAAGYTLAANCKQR